jgi:prophage regulatory protein
MERFLRIQEVQQRTGLKKSTLYLYIKQGRFPKPVPVTDRLVAWPESEVQAWIEARIKAARPVAAVA